MDIANNAIYINKDSFIANTSEPTQWYESVLDENMSLQKKTRKRNIELILNQIEDKQYELRKIARNPLETNVVTDMKRKRKVISDGLAKKQKKHIRAVIRMQGGSSSSSGDVLNAVLEESRANETPLSKMKRMVLRVQIMLEIQKFKD